MREAIAFVQTGKIGKVNLARGLCYKLRGSIGKVNGPQQPPKTMDYDLWCGPAPKKPPHATQRHRPLRLALDLGLRQRRPRQPGHSRDGQGPLGSGQERLPKSVVSVGGRFGYVDDGETPNTQICVFDYGDCELIFEVRGLQTDRTTRAPRSATSGTAPRLPGLPELQRRHRLHATTARSSRSSERRRRPLRQLRQGRPQPQGRGSQRRHSRRPSSSALCHLGNISYRLGEEQPFGQKPQAFAKDKDAGETFERMEQHLKDNEVSLTEFKCRIGRKLDLNPTKESSSTTGGQYAADARISQGLRGARRKCNLRVPTLCVRSQSVGTSEKSYRTSLDGTSGARIVYFSVFLQAPVPVLV